MSTRNPRYATGTDKKQNSACGYLQGIAAADFESLKEGKAPAVHR